MDKEQKDHVTKLEYLVVHKLNKERNHAPSIELRKSVNSITEKSLALVNKLYEAYKNSSKKTYGIFSEESGVENFSDGLFKFYCDSIACEAQLPQPKKDELVKNAFLEFSCKAMEIYKNRIASANLATGGYTLFALFSTKSTKYFITLVLSEHQQFLIKKDLEIDDTEAINIKNIHLGCLVNLSKWQTHFNYCFESYSGSTPESPSPAEGSYLSFTSQAGKEVSEYFINFIGATDIKDEKRDTQEIIKYIEEFLDEKELNDNEKRARKSNLYNHIEPSLNKKKAIQLETISAYISNPENNNEFIEFLNERHEEHQISFEIVLNKNRMSSFGNVKIKRKAWFKYFF